MWSWPRIKRQKGLMDTQEAVSWQHLSIRPTQLGINLVLIAAAIWVAALNYAVNLAYGLAFWILSATAVAALLSIRQLLGLRLDIKMPNEVFAGELAEIDIALDAKDLRSRMLIVRFIEEEGAKHSLSKQDLNTLHTHGQGSGQAVLHVQTSHRGYEHLPWLQLISTAPFGLLEVSVVCECQETFVVYPAPQEHTVSVSGRQVAEDAGHSRKVGGDEVAYLKAYEEGQSLQTIAWKQYAKTGTLLSKHFEEPMASRPDVISYKDYPQVRSLDQLASLLCHRVLEQSTQQQHYVLELPSQVITPQSQQRSLCLNALAVM